MVVYVFKHNETGKIINMYYPSIFLDIIDFENDPFYRALTANDYSLDSKIQFNITTSLEKEIEMTGPWNEDGTHNDFIADEAEKYVKQDLEKLFGNLSDLFSE